jgi:hypothetical protein
MLPGRRRSWSGWGGIDQRDGIIDLCGSGWLEKTNERGSNRLRSGSKPNSIGAQHNEAIGCRMTHSQGSNSVAKHSALIGSHARLFPRHSILSHQNTEKFQGMASFNARTDTGFSFSRLLPALPSQQGSHIAAPASSTPARSRWPEADPTNTTVTQSYHRETASTQKAEVKRTGGHISGARLELVPAARK